MKQKVIGFLGDFYHQKKPMETAIFKAADSVGLNFDCQFLTQSDFAYALAQMPEAIVIGAENRVNPEDAKVNVWLNDNIDDKLESYVENGGSLIVIHSGLASYPPESKFRKLTKGSFVSHPPEHCEVRYYTPDLCGISDGSPSYDFKILDEFYIVEVDVDQTNVFLYSSCNEHGTNLAGWYHNYGEGKVVCLVPTHNQKGFEHPETLRLFADVLKWAMPEDDY